MPEKLPAKDNRKQDEASKAETVQPQEYIPAGSEAATEKTAKPLEQGGPAGPEPTRYGDWERKGRCIDF
ncbi:MAG: DUF1674 domain-containing protein [Gammaproteobacteria bacterium]